MNDHDTKHRDRLDQATAARLAKLADHPVDTTRVERRLEQMWHQDAASAHARLWWQRPQLAAAAAMVLLVLIGWVFYHDSAPAMAEPGEVSQLHHEMVTSHVHVEPVEDIAAANRVIAERWRSAPKLPDVSLPARGCCLHRLAGRRVAAVQLIHDEAPVTMVVAHSTDLDLPAGRQVNHAGQQFIVQNHDGITMVMTRDQTRWLCVAGDLPEQELLAIASRVEYQSVSKGWGRFPSNSLNLPPTANVWNVSSVAPIRLGSQSLRATNLQTQPEQYSCRRERHAYQSEHSHPVKNQALVLTSHAHLAHHGDALSRSM